MGGLIDDRDREKDIFCYSLSYYNLKSRQKQKKIIRPNQDREFVLVFYWQRGNVHNFAQSCQSSHSSTFNHLTFYARVIFRIVSKQLFFANVISRDYSLFISPGQECQFCCHLRHFSEPIMVISLNQGNEPLSLNSTPLYLNRLRSYYSP